MSEVDCPQCGGDGSGGNNEFACGLCNGVGSVTRPQPSAEPVAVWLYEHPAIGQIAATERWQPDDVTEMWTETPLYTADQLQAYGDARAREMRDRAVLAYEAETDTWKAWPQAGAAKRKGAKAIRALKENPNG